MFNLKNVETKFKMSRPIDLKGQTLGVALGLLHCRVIRCLNIGVLSQLQQYFEAQLSKFLKRNLIEHTEPKNS